MVDLFMKAGFTYQLLTEHPDVDFVQFQINYADWENPKVASRANYEMARKHGKSIVVMEPVKGGALANPPGKVRELFDSQLRECPTLPGQSVLQHL